MEFNPVRQFMSMIFATFELIESVECIAGWLNGRVCAPGMIVMKLSTG